MSWPARFSGFFHDTSKATFVWIIGAFATMALSVFLYFPNQQEKVLIEALDQKARAMSQLMAYNIAPALDFDNEKDIRQVFAGASQDGDLVYVALFDADGKKLVEHNPAKHLIGSPPILSRTGSERSLDRLHLWTPITTQAGKRGWLALGLSTQGVVEKSAQNRMVAGFIALIITFGGLLLGTFVARAVRRMARLADDMQRARQEAEEASRVKSQFLANMSHEIRTPLNGVIGMTELVMATPLDPRQREFARAIQLSGRNLLRIVNDILDFSKIEAGRLSLEEIGFDLNECIEEAISGFAKRAEEKRVELIAQLSPTLPSRVKGDPLRLQQVLVNLIGNAIKFTERGEIRVHAHEERRDATHAWIRIVVEDTGIGMTREQMQRIFAPFSQADDSMTRKFGGTGLGLAISLQLVELMGGKITVGSEAGHGTAFHFNVRLTLDPTTASAPLRRHDGLRVLIVDDNATNRTILTEHLKAWGALPVEAADGKTALAELSRALESGQGYDLGIVDGRMPEMSGLELTRRIRDDAALGRLPVVMLSSLADDLEVLHRAGVTVHLHKPVRLALLAQALDQALSPASVPEPSETKPVNPGTAPALRARLLVAEDNPINQTVLLGMLQLLGCEARVVETGGAAIQALEEDPSFQLVFMDCQMPEMDGYTAARIIREREATKASARIPIVAVTAHALEEERQKAKDAGMDDYVTKPIDLKTLREAIERYSAVDPHVLASLKRLSTPKRPRFFEGVVASYARDAEQMMSAMREAAGRSDTASLVAAASQLKASSVSVGAKKVTSLVEQLSAEGQSGTTGDLNGLLAQLEQELVRTRNVLTAECAN